MIKILFNITPATNTAPAFERKAIRNELEMN